MKNKQLIIGLLVGVVSVYAVSSFIVKEKLDGLRVRLDEKISIQHNVVKELALSISVRTDDRVSSIIAECPANESSQYDRLLSSLDKGLTKAEMQGLNILFERCGSVPASRRATMTLLFDREVSFYSELVQQRALLGDIEATDYNIAKWITLAEREKEVSSLFFDLLNSQRQIISTLATGGSLKDVEPYQVEAGKIQIELSTIADSASEIRSALIQS